MSRSTIIFQEQPNGGYKGIYVENDGHIKGVGEMLHYCYQDTDKTADLIESKSMVLSLGATGEQINTPPLSDPRRSEKVQIKETMKYVFKYTLVQENETLELLADDEEEIALETYEARDNHGNVCQGLDNIGYYYYQEADGEWYVAYKNADEQMMIKPLSQIFNK